MKKIQIYSLISSAENRYRIYDFNQIGFVVFFYQSLKKLETTKEIKNMNSRCIYEGLPASNLIIFDCF